jgi:hypothetical protein
MIMEKLVEWLAGETEVLGENLPQCHFVNHKPHMLTGREPGPPLWEASDEPPNLWIGFAWKQRQKPVSELCFEI